MLVCCKVWKVSNASCKHLYKLYLITRLQLDRIFGEMWQVIPAFSSVNRHNLTYLQQLLQGKKVLCSTHILFLLAWGHSFHTDTKFDHPICWLSRRLRGRRRYLFAMNKTIHRLPRRLNILARTGMVVFGPFSSEDCRVHSKFSIKTYTWQPGLAWEQPWNVINPECVANLTRWRRPRNIKRKMARTWNQIAKKVNVFFDFFQQIFNLGYITNILNAICFNSRGFL